MIITITSNSKSVLSSSPLPACYCLKPGGANQGAKSPRERWDNDIEFNLPIFSHKFTDQVTHSTQLRRVGVQQEAKSNTLIGISPFEGNIRAGINANSYNPFLLTISLMKSLVVPTVDLPKNSSRCIPSLRPLPRHN